MSSEVRAIALYQRRIAMAKRMLDEWRLALDAARASDAREDDQALDLAILNACTASNRSPNVRLEQTRQATHAERMVAALERVVVSLEERLEREGPRMQQAHDELAARAQREERELQEARERHAAVVAKQRAEAKT